MRSGGLRAALAMLFVAQGALVLSAVWTEMRFHAVHEHKLLALSLLSVLFGMAAICVIRPAANGGSRILRVVLPVLASIVAVRYWMPVLLAGQRTYDLGETRAIAALRLVAAGQEDVRIRQGAYSRSVDAFPAGIRREIRAAVRLEAFGDSGWEAHATALGATCRIRLWRGAGMAPWPDAIPNCDSAPIPERQRARSAPARRPFPSHVGGTFVQHRGDARRSGLATTGSAASVGAVRWTARVDGELRASASIAGEQVFVGAHGNGEVVALHLEDGVEGWRSRAPNWVHHEPVVGDSLLFLGVGNNEFGTRVVGMTVGEEAGSPPSGVVAFSRADGALRWFAPMTGSVMGAPVIDGASVVAISHYGEMRRWRASDGELEWRSKLPSGWHAPMTNPLLVDSLLVLASEPNRWCVVAVATGRVVYCVREPRVSHGFGHVSPAAAAGSVFLVGVDADDARVSRVGRLACVVAGLMCAESERETEAQVVAAFSLRDGTSRWRTRVDGRHEPVRGHFAGTPTFLGDSVLVVPLPRIGEVVALSIDDGALLWRAPIRPARGSVTSFRDAILVASVSAEWLVLDASNGNVRCRQALSATPDRAGLTSDGVSGVLTLADGTVIARSLEDWAACR